MKRFAVMLLLLCLLLAALPALADNEYYGNMEVVNCNEWVSLRERPSTAAKRLVKVSLGAVVSNCRQFKCTCSAFQSSASMLKPVWRSWMPFWKTSNMR